MRSAPGQEGSSARTPGGCAVVIRRIDTKGKRIVPGRFDSSARTLSPGALWGVVSLDRRVRRGGGAQCSGTVSTHLFRAESRVARMRCSHCFPTKPRTALEFFVEYYRNHQRPVRTIPRTAHQSSKGECKDLCEFSEGDETAYLCRVLGRRVQARLPKVIVVA